MCMPPAGNGVVPERRYRQATSIIQGLEAYRRARGTYPDSLAQLVPGFLSPEQLTESRTAPDSAFAYSRSGTEYSLRFHYIRPGMNRCEYRSSVPRWLCSGYF